MCEGDDHRWPEDAPSYADAPEGYFEKLAERKLTAWVKKRAPAS